MYRTLAVALLCTLFAIPPVSALETTGDLSKQLSTQLQTNRERYGIAGQAVLVAHNGQVLYRAPAVNVIPLPMRLPLSIRSSPPSRWPSC